MVTAELRVGWHGAGPVRAVAWWAFADGSTSDQLQALRPTREQAVQAVREAASALIEGRAPIAPDGQRIERYAPSGGA